MELPQGTVTLLFSDLEGSTRLWEELPQQMGEIIARHDEVIHNAVTSHGGIDLLKRGEGDSHFAVFSKATDAAACAIDIHRQLSQDINEIELRVRIAIHTGEVELRGEDYFGQTPNRCGRLRAAAHGGQTILSESTKQLIEDSLPPGASLKPLGLHRFKDLLQPEKIYQLDFEGSPGSFPELRSLSPAKHNLPIQLTSFVGREEEIRAIRAELENKRLVTLIGAGGSGKTRLSQQIAAEAIDQFPDGAWFVGLVSTQDGRLIPQKIADSLPISLGGRDPMKAICEEFATAKALIVLDNCEHLIKEAAATVNSLLQNCSHITVLATSREPLAIKGECLYNVPPLDCDLKLAEPTIDSVGALEAAQLLRDRAAARLSGEDILTESSAPAVAALCKKLDGIPLALEQAAANMHTLSPEQILQRIENQFAMLPLDEQGVDERHVTMQATIAWSYGMLGDMERKLFGRLSFFASGWSLDAAEHICGSDGIDEGEVFPTLDRLIKRSMIVAETAEWGDRRYRMLEPIREFAVKQNAPETEQPIRARHFDWYRNLARRAFDYGSGLEGKAAKSLSAEHDNIRTALKWGLANPEHAIDTLELCTWMHPFWLHRGHVREGASWIERALTKAQGAPEQLQATALNCLGVLLWQAGNLDSARELIEKSRGKWERLGDRSKVAAALNNLAGVAFMKGDFPAAISRLEEVVQILRSVGEPTKLANGLENLGVAYSKNGDVETATIMLEEAVTIHRSASTPEQLAKALDSYIGLFAQRGAILQAAGLFIEALDIAVEAHNDFILANLFELAIRICIELNDFELAAQSYGAMTLAIDRTQRKPPPVQLEMHKEFADQLTEHLGKDTFKRLTREGRALGPEAVMLKLKELLLPLVEQQPTTETSFT